VLIWGVLVIIIGTLGQRGLTNGCLQVWQTMFLEASLLLS